MRRMALSLMRDREDDGKWEQGRKRQETWGPFLGVCVGSQLVNGIDALMGWGTSVLPYEDEGNEWRSWGVEVSHGGAKTSQGCSGNCRCLQ